MAARKVGGEVAGSTGTKRREKVEDGEDHDWLVLEAERVEPGLTAVTTAVKVRKVKNRKWNMFEVVCVNVLLDAFERYFWLCVWKLRVYSDDNGVGNGRL